jgi:hypothetical protein
MWTAIILTCHLDTTTCKSVSPSVLYTSEDICLKSLALGIQTLEGNRWVVKDYLCHQWGQSS